MTSDRLNQPEDDPRFELYRERIGEVTYEFQVEGYISIKVDVYYLRKRPLWRSANKERSVSLSWIFVPSGQDPEKRRSWAYFDDSSSDGNHSRQMLDEFDAQIFGFRGRTHVIRWLDEEEKAQARLEYFD